MIVVGFDPGLSAAGIAVIDSTSLRCLAARTVRTSCGLPLSNRMEMIANALSEALDGAELLVIEDQHGVFFARLAAGKSNPAAGRLAQVVGLAQGMASARGVPALLITPQRVRQRIALSANAKKQQIGRAIRMQVAGVGTQISNHATDAVAIALAGAREWHGHQIKMSAVKAVLNSKAMRL